MKILVTGGAGFIGSHVAELFLSKEHKVSVVDNLSSGKRTNIPAKAKFFRMDIRSSKIEKMFQKEEFDVVCHHAAQISVPYSVDHPEEDAGINTLGTLNLLENCKRFKVKKFIFISSGGTVYGEPKKLPCTEKYPLDPLNPYGISKVTGEYYLRFYARQFGLKYTILRYSNVYGPRQEPHGEAGVVAIFIKAILEGKRPIIFGDGGCIRDYVFVQDVARANLLALSKGQGQAFNIGTSRGATVKQLFNMIKKAMGYQEEPFCGPPRKGDLRANTLSYQKARYGLGWSPQVKLEIGVQETIKYFTGLARRHVC